ncbi:Calx-beta domain-containing protein [Spongiivirga sp. MCCC 1A20706]|uniref:Calx-beta domain-containing protein n=1 Tax=Spongiivirga sp. MCCC 1A20706 TaxID=3160963 RepID=UPI003977A39C
MTFAGTNGETETFTIPIIDDSLVEPSENFVVDLSNVVSAGSVSISDAQGAVTITDNDAASIAINDVTVAEAAGTATFTVTLTGDVQGGFTVDYATADNSAIQPGDYTTSSGTLTFTGTDTETQTFTVPIIDDSLVEATESFFANLSSLSNGLVTISDAQGEGTITDNDAASIAINDVTVSEAAGTATLTVTLTGNVQGGFQVNYATANDSAIEPNDYTDSTGTLTFAGTDTETQTFTVPIIDDTDVESSEDFFVNLSGITNALVTIADSQGVGTITDNDTASVSIDDVTVSESAGTATFTVTLTGNVQGGFTIDYATADNSATAPADYTNTSGSLTFTGTNNETQTITVPIIDDLVVGPTIDYFVNLSNISNTLVTVADNQGLGTITDDDNASVSIDDVTVNEGAGILTFTVTLNNAVQGGFDIDYATAQNTALAGTDYTTSTGTLTFVGTAGETQTFDVPITDDSLVESTESFFADLSSLTNPLVTIADAQGEGTITDNDAASIAIDDVTVSEAAGTATFTVTLTGDVQGGFQVNYATADNTATSPIDYTSTGGTLTFAGTDAETVTFTVPIIDDALVGPTEDFFVNLSGITNTLVTIADSQGVGTITDNDSASISIDDVTVSESAGTATFTVTLTGGVDGSFTIDYATADNSAVAPADYTITTGSLTFVGTNNETQTITVPIIDDLVVGPTIDYFVNLSNISNTLVTVADNQGLGTITDDDNASVSINDVTVNEGAGILTFTVTLNNAVQGGFDIDYATAQNTALAGTDYTTSTGTLTFVGTAGETQTFNVPITDDSLVESTESFFADLSSLTNPLVTIADAQGEGIITDNDAASIAIDDVTVNEAAGTATFTVTLTGDVQGGLQVNYATADNTAIAPGDYTNTAGTLTFVGTDTETQTFTVPIIDDTLVEPSETFFAGISGITNTLVTISDNQGQATITDNDAASIAINSITVNEAVGNAVLSVTLTGDVQGSFTVQYDTADNTAIAPGDYTATTAGTITFVGNDAEVQTISIPISDDILVESSEDFTVTLSNISNALVSNGTSTGTVTITDNDNATIAINDVTVNENAGTATFDVTLTGDVQGGFTVDYITAANTAIENTDYDAASGTLTFTGTNNEVQSITVTINEDSLVEPTEDYFVNLSNISVAAVTASDNQGLGQITDNDAASIAIDDVTVNEAAGTATFTVTLTGDVQGSLQVNYATADNTAIAPGDYTNTAGTLTFVGTDTETQTFTVPIIDDTLVEPSETFFAGISGITNTLVTISDNQGQATITDNDAASIAINSITVNEAVGNAVLSVTLTGDVQGSFTVQYDTADNTAIAPGDYTATTAGTITFVGNDAEVQTISIPISDDILVESSEDFTVTLSNISNALVSNGTSTGTVTITDNDNATIAINDVTVNENAGTATFDVTLTGDVQGGFTVDYITAANTAIENTDYDAASGTLTFTGTNNEVQSITVTINEDSLVEPTEDYFVNLSNISVAAVTASDNQGLGQITDNDAASIAIDDVTVNEAAGTATFTVTLTGDVQGGFQVDYDTASGSAIQNTDFTQSNGTLTFAGTDAETQTFTVAIADDNLVEPTENYVVNLSGLTSTLVTISDAQGEGTITDNDAASIAINDITVNEGAGTATLTVTLTGNTQSGFTVDYATANNTAIAPGDYTASTGTLTFVGNTGEQQTLIVPIVNDVLVEASESLFVDLSGLNTALVTISDAQGEITINDNDTATIAINDVIVVESAGTATFDVTLTGDVQGGFTVDYITAANTAIENTDYDAASGTLTFTGTNNEVQSITVTINEDSLVEPTEDYFVNLNNISVTAVTASDNQGLGQITDNDAASIAIDDVTVNEAAGTATFTVTLTGDVQGGFSVNYATSGVSAIQNTDYTGATGTLNFVGTDAETQTFTVAITEDTLVEATETYLTTLSGLSTTLVTISDSQGTGTITDNDAASIAINDITVNENNGTATVTVTLTGDVQGGFTVDYDTASGTAIQGTDFTASSGTLTFTGTDTETQTITIPITNDALTEGDENFVVDLSGISNALVTVADNQSTVTITDDDVASISINDVNVSEGAGTATFTVTLTGDVQSAFSVNYATSDNTAVSPSDFTSSSGTLNFTGTDGETQTFTVPIIDDILVESSENFNALLSGITNPLVTIADDTGVGTISDNDSANVVIDDVSVDEAAGTATFTVTLSAAVAGGFSIDYISTATTAIEGTDYTGVAGTLNFVGTAGETQTISVTITDDSLVESNEGYTIDLSNISTVLVSIDDSQGVGTITDNDAASIVINDISVAENAGNAVFTVTLTGDVQGGFSVNYATAGNTAAQNTDFTETTGALNFVGTTGETQTITIPIIDDTLLEPTENYFVNLGAISNTLVTINDPQGEGTITDNDAASIAIDDVTVNESAGTATFTVTLTGDVQGGFTVDYATATNTAVQGTDFTAATGTLSFTGTNNETQTFIVPITNDNLLEAVETYFADLSNVSNTNVVVTTAQGVGTITDDDSASIAIDDVSVNEAAGTATFTVTLTGDVQGSFDVDFATADNTANAGADYTANTGTITFTGNDAETQTITITITDDAVAELAETYFVNLSGITNPLVTIADAQGLGTITDNDASGIAIDDVTVDESAGNAIFTVTLTGAIAGGFSVDYNTSGSSASQGVDYTGVSGTLNFVGTDAETQQIIVPITEDTLDEIDEIFNVDLSNVSTGLVTINDAQGVGTITDNDTSSINIADVIEDENNGTITFTVTLTGDVQGGFDIDYATTDGTALNPADYANTSGTLSFAGTDGETQSFTVAIVDDILLEADETFTVDLSGITNTLVTVTNSQATGTITDNDAASLSIDDITVNEAAGTANFTITLTGDVQGGFDINYATADNTALAGSDYTANTGTITFTGNDAETQQITVNITDDTLLEATEGYFVNLSGITNALVNVTKPQGIGTITDNDAATLTIDDVTVDEDAGIATFTISLTGEVQDSFVVSYTTADNSATQPDDYTLVTGNLNFTGTNGETRTVLVPIIDDVLVEADETYFVNITGTTNPLVVVGDSQGLGTINDNDAASLAIDDITVNETAGTAVFTVTLTGDVQGAFSINYASSGVTAIENTDYTGVAGTLNFAGTDGETQTITVAITDDLLVEANETYNIDLSGITNALISVTKSQGVGTITDNDSASIAIDDVSVNEAAGTATFTVTLTGAVQGGFDVDFTTADDTAIAGSDYTANSGTLSFTGTNNETQTITVNITNDNLLEPTETYFVNLSNITNTLVTISDSQGLGSITNDDAASIAINDVTVNEAAGTADFTVTLTGDVQGSFTIDYLTSQNTAIENTDYTAGSGTITFTGTNAETQTISIAITDDSLLENTETFNVNLSNISNALVTFSDSQGEGTITDNDAASIAIDDVSVNEAAGTATFTVTLTGSVQGGFTANYTTADDTAIAGADYTATTGTLTFVGTDTETQTITVAIADDNLVEPSEDYFVNITSVSNVLVTIADNQGLGTITDNDAASVVIDDVTVAEDAGTATFTVTLTGDVQGGFDINYATADDSAIAGSDYTATSGTLNFTGTNGETQTITVSITDDVLLEATETYFVNLSGITNTLVTVSDSQGLGTITDNDAASLAIDDVVVNENAGTATFTVTLTGDVQNSFTVNYATASGTAIQDTDYTGTTGTLNFTGTTGETQTITIAIADDTLVELAENYFVDLSGVSNALVTLADARGEGTITDDDAASISINDVSVNEAAGTATFNVTLTGDVQGAFTVGYQTADNTAIAGADYSNTTGTLNFTGNNGEIRTVTVVIIDDSLVEPTEDYFVNLVSVSNALVTIADNQGLGTITDNDNATVAIDDVTVSEGAGTATFTVTLTGDVQGGFDIDYASADDTALAGSDYTAVTNTLTFVGTNNETQTITVPITEDTLLEDLETYFINLSGITNTLVTVTDAQGLGSITNNDAASLAINDITVDEAIGNATLTVTLTGDVQGSFSIDYATASNNAIEDTDYTGTSGTLTFVGNDAETQTILIPITDDSLLESTESFFVNLSTLTNPLVTLADAQGEVTITDNDLSGISIDDVSVAEDAGVATFTVTLTGAVQGGFTVDWATADNTAIAPGDYVTDNNTLTFVGTDGETQTITITINEDTFVEFSEDYFVNLSNISNALVNITKPQGVGTITDNDAANLVINDVSVDEDAGNAVFTVTLSGSDVPGGFNVQYDTADGTAVAPGDYTAAVAGVVTFAGTDGETQTITIPIQDDSLVESTEDYTVNLSNVSTVLVTINDGTGLGEIVDNDNASIAINDVTVNEAAGTAVYEVLLTGAVQGGFTVNYATADNTATDPADYTAQSGTLTFVGTNFEIQTITVPIIDDNLLEATESFFTNLSAISNTLVTISDAQGITRITDNDTAGIDINSITVNENAGTAQFDVTLTGNVQGGFTVNYSTTNDTAIQPDDYTQATGTLTFTGNDTEVQSFTVPIIDDAVLENSEDFFANLTGISNALVDINTAQGTGTITDNDTATISINDVSVAEDAGTAVFTATLNGAVQGGVDVDFAAADITAVSPGDYSLTAGTISFTGTNGETQTITVTINDDTLVEPTETYNVDLSNPSNPLVTFTDNQGLGTITDNDVASVAINDITIAEDGVTATLTVTLTGDVQGGFDIDFQTTDNTAVAPGDFTATTGTLNFTGTDGETATIDVTIIDDTLLESPESLFVDLSGITNTLVTVSDSQGEITITDNDAASIAINSITVDEAIGNAVLSITLTGDVQGSFTVEYDTADNTAVAPGDYTAAVSGVLTFTGNDAEVQTISIPITDDLLLESTEDLTVTLSNLSNALVGNPSPTGTVTITDNDNAEVNINNVTVNEAAGTATFDVTLTGAVQGGFDIDFAGANGTATDPDDFGLTNGTLSFTGTDGEIQQITVSIVDDSLLEPTEEYTITLSNITNTLVVINTATGTGTITDNDTASIAINDVTVDEDAGTATLNVTLTGDVQGNFAVNYATADNTAVQPGDYTTSTGILNFVGTDGEVQPFTIPIIDDNLLESVEDFVANLSGITNALVTISDASGTVTINDNDAASLAINDVSVAEDAGIATFTVTLTGNVQGAFTVDYQTAQITAVENTDYTASVGTLNFTGTNAETRTFVVPILEDTLVEPTEDYFANLISVSNTLITFSDAQGLGSITDNDNAEVDIDSVTVDEDAGTATFTVTLTGDVQGGFDIDFATADGTAVQPGDYTTTNGTLSFAGTDGETQTITVTIIDDLLVEPNEDYTVTISNISNTLVTIDTAVGTGIITDQDNASVVIDDVIVAENAGTATFTVSLTGAVQGGFTLDYLTAEDTAIQNTDYDAASGTLTFAGTDGETQTITVNITDDTLLEPDETYFVDLASISNPLVMVLDAQGLGTITNDDVASIAINDQVVDEDAGTATFTVTLTGDVQNGFTIDYASADNSAIQGTDYDAVSGTLTFTGTTGEALDITVNITDDTLLEPTEDYFINLLNISNTNVTITDGQGLGTIIDNDAAVLGIAGPVTVNEAAGTATFIVTLTGDVQGSFDVDYATADGTALAGSDYTAAAGTLTFAGTDGEQQLITVNITDDALVEPTEDYTVTISNVSNALIGLGTTVSTGNIADNDTADLSIDDVSVDEAAGTATFTVTLTGGVQDPFTIDYATSNGTAVEPSDYTANTGTLNFTGTDGETQTITITIIDDAILETTEDYFVTLSGISTPLVNVADASGLGEITNNDAASLAINDVTVAEDAGVAIFEVTLTGGVQGSFTVDYATAGGTAIQDTDYTGTTGTLTFTGTDAEVQTITVPIIDDNVLEPLENYVVDLVSVSNTDITFSDAQGDGGITNNDVASIDITNITVNEADGNATFDVTLTGNVQDGFTIDYATIGNTATLGTDFNASAGTLTFVGNDAEVLQITVPIIDDLIVEPTEDYTVNLSNISNTAVTITNAAATGQILDNDNASIAINDITVNEADGTATLVITLTGGVQGGLTVDFATADNSAVSPADFGAVSGTATFVGTDGETQNVTVTIVDDVDPENTESLFINLSNLSTPLVTIADASGEITIIDTDIAVNPDIESTNEDTPVDIAVLDNDLFATDDTVVVTSTTSPANGTVVINPDGTITYTPAGDYTGIDTFDYTVTVTHPDSSTSTGTATITVNVLTQPDVVPDIIVVAEDDTVTFNPLDNDLYTGSTAAITAVGVNTAPANGSVVLNGDGTVTYTPDPDYFGTDIYSYTVTVTNPDSSTTTETTIVTVTINQINDAIDDTVTTDEDTPINFDSFVNDTFDPTTTIDNVVITGPTNGTVVVELDGTFTYTPDPDYNGPDAFIYEVTATNSNGFTFTESATVNINVTPVVDAIDDLVVTDEDVAVNFDPLANDTFTSTNISITNVTSPQNGTVTVEPDGTLTYTPTPDFDGTDTFDYTVTVVNADLSTTTETATVTVTVNPVQDAFDDNRTMDEDTGPLNIDVLTNDTYNPISRIFVSSTTTPSNGTVTINPDNTVDYTPNADFNGLDQFDYTVTLAINGVVVTTETATVFITVNPVQDSFDDTATTDEDTPVTIDVLANDTYDSGTNLAVTSTTSPANGTVTINADNTVTYTPNSDFNGTDTFDYVVTVTNADFSTTTETATVTITVNPVADTVDDTATTDEDVPVTIDVLANDTFGSGTNLAVTSTTTPANGTVTINGDNTVTYTPDADFNGTDSFDYEVTVTNADATTTTETATVTITVNPVADAIDDTATTPEDTAVNIDVLANDTFTSTNIAVTATTTPANGTVTINADNTVTYTPNADFNGTDTFDYTVTVTNGDGSTSTETATVTVDVTPVDDAIDDNATTDEDTPVTIDVLANDTFTNTNIAVTSTTSPANGTATINPDNTITYTPGPDFSGTDTFTYEVTVTNADGSQTTETAVVTITVNPIPDAIDDTASTDEDTTATIDVLANDTFINTNIAVTNVTTPTYGVVTINADNTITYVPEADFVGTDTFDYEVTITFADGSTETDTATVTITVNPIQDVEDDTATTDFETPVTIDVLANDTFEGTSIAVTAVSTPANGSVVINSDNTVTYTPNTNFFGTDTFTYTVTVTHSDGSTNTETATVTITVNEQLIDAIDDTNAILADGPNGQIAILNVLDNDILGTGAPTTAEVTITVITPDPDGVLTLNPDGTVDVAAGTPTGIYTIEYQICEIINPTNCDTAIVIIAVDGDNDGDGIYDSIDLDDDNDGIPDDVEEGGTPGRDTDGDGIPDIYDLDSDGDGVLDIYEAGHDGVDADGDGTVDGPYGTNGLADSIETSPDSDNIDYNVQDTDGDGEFDFQDIDDDGDDVDTIFEGADPDGDGNPNTGDTQDTDGDGIPDYLDNDDDGDAIATIDENPDPNDDGNPDDAFDADGDGIPDYLEPNNANLEEEVEVYNVITPNGDGDHDRLIIRNLEEYPNNTLTIFNRWGVEVFKSQGYGQDGRFFTGVSEGRVTVQQQRELPVGTYYYILTYVKDSGEEVKKAGYIYIQR